MNPSSSMISLMDYIPIYFAGHLNKRKKKLKIFQVKRGEGEASFQTPFIALFHVYLHILISCFIHSLHTHSPTTQKLNSYERTSYLSLYRKASKKYLKSTPRFQKVPTKTTYINYASACKHV